MPFLGWIYGPLPFLENRTTLAGRPQRAVKLLIARSRHGGTKHAHYRHLKAEFPAKVSHVGEAGWRVSNDGLGIYAYGETIDDAMHGLLDNLNAITNVYRELDRMDALRARFERASIHLTEETENVSDAPMTEPPSTTDLQVSFGKVLQYV